ncbi:GT-D fold domain-containing glycosyltransferase [Fructilactobacillus vespulae]|uniref:GT-D fold domain-containing glycosyltransferase n=1 Tax=Fructilactobacillus vespulae TaxID=1249630 RepID=UPI0039B543C0
MKSKVLDIAWKIFSDSIYIPVFKIKFEKQYHNFEIASIEDTISKIKSDNVSVSRFGDGEFKWMSMARQDSFEKNSTKMSIRLKEVLQNEKKHHINCLPQAFKDTKTMSANKYWEREMGIHGKEWLSYLDKNVQYYNTSITRPYIDFKNKNEHTSVFNQFKTVWEDKDVLIVEGFDTKFGMGNDLLNNTKSIHRIECPSKNAFESYDYILKESKIAIDVLKPQIVLAAIGPTATILSYDLANYNGVQAIDIGHLDIEYEWFLKKTNKRIAVPGKFVNEVAQQITSENKFDDDIYEKQIFKKINGD